MATAALEDDPWLGCDQFSPAFRDDPHPMLHALRAKAPVHLTPVGIWRLTRYADVYRLLHQVPAGVRTTDGHLPGIDELTAGPRLFMLQRTRRRTRGSAGSSAARSRRAPSRGSGPASSGSSRSASTGWRRAARWT